MSVSKTNALSCGRFYSRWVRRLFSARSAQKGKSGKTRFTRQLHFHAKRHLFLPCAVFTLCAHAGIGSRPQAGSRNIETARLTRIFARRKTSGKITCCVYIQEGASSSRRSRGSRPDCKAARLTRPVKS